MGQNYWTGDLRSMWSGYLCKRGGTWTDVKMFGKGIGGVPSVLQDPYHAMESALISEGYNPPNKAVSVWSYNCRPIAGSSAYSLHSYGIAIDIDPTHNPFSSGGAFTGWFQQKHVDAVMRIRNTAGMRMWYWAGLWGTPDRMHFQIDVSPNKTGVDWSTVPGGEEVATWKSNDGYTYNIDDWGNYSDAIKWMINKKLMLGTRNKAQMTGDFKAGTALKRREFAQVIQKFASDAGVKDEIDKD